MPERKLSYVICAAPGTESSSLCAALGRTGIAGQPAEYFHVDAHNETHWRTLFGIQGDAEYLTKVLDAGTTPNGIFGFQLYCDQASAVIAKLRADREARDPLDAAAPECGLDSMVPLLHARLGETRYIWLRRKNKIAQAISWYRTGRTEDRWHSAVGGVLPPGPVEFEYEAIRELVREVELFDQAWFQFFMRHQLRALIVVFEDFITDYEKTVRGTLDFLDQKDPALPVVAPQYLLQADDRSADWERRYIEQMKRDSSARPYTPDRTKRSTKAAAIQTGEPAETLPLIAYDLRSGIEMAIQPAPPTRKWMDEVPGRFAYRCLPLVIANQSGWLIHNPRRLTVTWDGSTSIYGLRVAHDDSSVSSYASSHFGLGVLTFNIGCLFRTPPGYNLIVRGPSNWPKDGIAALEGIVETDWNPATFTMNWKITRPNHAVVFEEGEPIAMIVPVLRGDVERFRPEIRPMSTNSELEFEYQEWSRSRTSFTAALKAGVPAAVAAGWQRHYVLGMTVTETDAPDHQTALKLAPFADKRTPKG